MNVRRLFGFLLAIALVPAVGRGGISESEFQMRRETVSAVLDSAAVAIFRSAETKQRSADVGYRYRQESNLLYLTGVNEPGVILVLTGRDIMFGGKPVRRILLVRPELQGRMAARGILKDGAVIDAGRLQEILSLALTGARVLYLSAPDPGFVNDWLNNRPLFLDRDARKEIERRFPGLKVKGAGPLVGRLRGIKSEGELALIRKSIKATGDGILQAMKISRPGLHEYQLQAAIENEMTNGGAEYVGFPSIIGSGSNSLILHYDDNRREMRDGEIVVMDVGAEMEGYSADVTRTIPVGGEFTPEQRNVYSAVLKAQNDVISQIKPGLPFAELDRLAKASLERSGFGKYMPHGVSHHVGLDTHDAGSMDTLRAGMVITVEPGIYIPAGDTTKAPAYRGWGVRIEDDVLVTNSGAEILSGWIPRDVEAIERHMRK